MAAEAGEAPPSLTDQGLRGFRDTMAEADGLGGAAAEARRSAREVYEAVPGEGAPRYGDAGHDTGRAATLFRSAHAAATAAAAGNS